MKIIFTAKDNNWDRPDGCKIWKSPNVCLFDEESTTFQLYQIVKQMVWTWGRTSTSQKVLDFNPDVIITGNGAGNKALTILQKSEVKMYTGAGEMTL